MSDFFFLLSEIAKSATNNVDRITFLCLVQSIEFKNTNVSEFFNPTLYTTETQCTSLPPPLAFPPLSPSLLPFHSPLSPPPPLSPPLKNACQPIPHKLIGWANYFLLGQKIMMSCYGPFLTFEIMLAATF